MAALSSRAAAPTDGIAIQFVYDTDARRCKPLIGLDETKRTTYPTLSKCRQAGGTDDGFSNTSQLDPDVQRLIGSMFGEGETSKLLSSYVMQTSSSGHSADPDDLKSIDTYRDLPLLIRDIDESGDLLQYYTSPPQGGDVVLALLRAGYGVNRLDSLLITKILDKYAADEAKVLAADVQLLNWAINNPHAISHWDWLARLRLWSWALLQLEPKVPSVHEHKDAVVDYVKSRMSDIANYRALGSESFTRLLKNVFPIVTEDASVDVLRNMQFDLRYFRNRSFVAGAVKAVLLKMLKSDRDRRDRRSLAAMEQFYRDEVCSTEHRYDPPYDDVVLEVIAQWPQLLARSPKLQHMVIERRLQTLGNLLNNIEMVMLGYNPGNLAIPPTVEQMLTYTEALDETVEEMKLLISRDPSIGSCFWPSVMMLLDGRGTELVKEIIRRALRKLATATAAAPLVMTRRDINRFIALIKLIPGEEDLNADAEQAEDDIALLVSVFARLDRTNPVNIDFIQSVRSTCDLGSYGTVCNILLPAHDDQ
jgi:hypothetical protein